MKKFNKKKEKQIANEIELIHRLGRVEKVYSIWIFIVKLNESPIIFVIRHSHLFFVNQIDKIHDVARLDSQIIQHINTLEINVN
jgi:hypothetical protein